MRVNAWALAVGVAVVLAVPASAAAATPGTGEAPAAAPGELIVRFEPQVEAREAARTLDDAGADTEERLPLPGLRLAEVDGGHAATREAIAELEREPGVLYAEPNLVRTLDATPNDPFFDELWGLESTRDADIDATSAWDGKTASGGLEVAVVDDGISYAHPDLVANVWTNAGESGEREVNGLDDDGNRYIDDTRGWDFADGDRDPAPVGSDGGHGTHVAGTIGAVGHNDAGVTGVAWRTELMALRVFDAEGRTTTAKIVEAFGYAARNGAEVVNGSFGGGGFSRPELDAIKAGAPRTLFVVAAGNETSDNDAFPTYPCNYDAQNLLCIAASNESDSLASFSNYGATSVDLAAPGTSILSTYPEELTPDGYVPYAYMSGTSMATPMTSGAAALVYDAMPGATAAEVARRLRATVDPVPALAGRVVTGGRLNLARALANDTASEPPPSASDSTAPPSESPPPPSEPAPPPPAPPEEPDPVLPEVADRTAPETRITRAPRRRSRDRTPTFRFKSTEHASGFRCRLDRKRARPCASPYRPGRVGRGRHVFKVVAVDQAGNHDLTAAKRRFRIVR